MIQRICIIFFSCLFSTSLVVAQEYATDKGAGLFNIMGSFSSSGGSLFEDDHGHYSNSATFGLTASRFIARNIFLGAGVGYGRQSQGALYNTTYGVGPHIGLAAGGKKNQAFPFVHVGIHYYGANMRYDDDYSNTIETKGSDIFGGIGLIIPIKKSIGIVFEGDYHALSLKDQDENHYGGKIFTLGIGLVGVFYK